MTEDLPTDPKGSEPPHEAALVDEMRTMMTHLLETQLGGLRADIVEATAIAAQVAEQLGRFNTNIEAIRHEVQRLNERMSDAEGRISKLEGKP